MFWIPFRVYWHRYWKPGVFFNSFMLREYRVPTSYHTSDRLPILSVKSIPAPRSTDPSASRSNLRLFRTPSQLSLANHPYALGSRSNSYASTQPRQSLTRSASRTSVQPTARRPSGFIDVGTTESVFSVAQQMERTFPLPSRQQVTPGEQKMVGAFIFFSLFMDRDR